MKSRIAIITLVLCAVGTSTVSLEAPARASTTAAPSLDAIFQSSLGVMSTIHSVHALGSSTEREVDHTDFNSTGAWRMQGDCATSGATTTIRLSLRGKVTGKHPRSVNMRYVIAASGYQPISVTWSRSWKVWANSAGAGTWRRVVPSHDVLVVASMCPRFLVRQLRGGLPGSIMAFTTAKVTGHTVWHIQSGFDGQGSGHWVDLYIDRATFRWLRVEQGGWGAGCCHSEHTTFDYSRFNAPVRVSAP